jgi:hypothetical protein
MKEQKSDSIANYLSILLNNSSQISRFGKMPSDFFKVLDLYTKQQVSYSTEKFILQKKLCFCYPNEPLLYPKSSEEVKTLWEMGATLNIQSIETHSHFFKELCCELERVLENTITCSLYISKPNALSFSYHTDEWVGIAVQVIGCKKFFLKSDEKVQEYTLSQGSWFRLDPNDIHKANAETFSVHLNFARHKNL